MTAFDAKRLIDARIARQALPYARACSLRSAALKHFIDYRSIRATLLWLQMQLEDTPPSAA